MAASYTHQSSVDESLERLTSPLSNNVIQQIQDDVGQPKVLAADDSSQPRRTKLAGFFRPIAMASNINSKDFNDVQLIRHRHVRYDPRVRKQLELLCEDKVSRYKFEEVHCSLPSSIKSTFIMTFSPDGQRVASTHGDHRIYICDLSTGKLLDTLEGHPKTPWCLAWHPSNREILASGCLAGEVRVWDLRSKACESWANESHTIITSLDFHPKERVLVIATANDVHFWDWSESEPFAKTTTMHDKEKVKFVVFDPSGTKLITGISNLPKFAGYSSDALQSRIIDGYLSHGTIETLQTDNMTQNSEITTSPINGTINTNENLGEPDAALASTSSGRRLNINLGGISGLNVNEQDVSYRNTMLLSRVASLYRQLESLEDSIRHTSFAPFLNYNPANIASTAGTSESNAQANLNCQSDQSKKSISTNNSAEQVTTKNATGSSEAGLQNQKPGSTDPNQVSSSPIMNTFEPYLVTFDESLEQLQLPPLVIDGQAINPVNVIDQYPVDLSRQLYHAMQFESINQVNQNFIRISKLMSSARLYRQVVQQIASGNTGNVPFQPNQVLIAQSVTPRSPRNSQNLPIVLRNFPVISNPLEARPNRHHDPILAIEFRNSARNVPLPTICKIDLLAARAICILRSQHLVEQALSDSRSSLLSSQESTNDITGLNNQESPRDNNSRTEDTTVIHSIIGQLHSTLTMINHAPITTSNAYHHITSLRVCIEKLQAKLSSLLSSFSDGERLCELMHKIAFSLTGRRWSVPLGATLDEIRLDVIHTLCIVDLTLHFTRQVQLLQMQRVSLITRVDESIRPGSTTTRVTSEPSELSVGESSQASSSVNSMQNEPGTSTDNRYDCKRKAPTSNEQNKRHKVEIQKPNDQGGIDIDALDIRAPPVQNVNHPVDSVIDQALQADRMVLWNSPQNYLAQSLQRYLVATSSSINSHILVRFYHRLPGGPQVHPYHNSSIAETPLEHRVSPQTESRRRALSQDMLASSQEPIDPNASAETPPARVRVGVRAPAPLLVPLSSNYNAASGAAYDAWQRQPHLHVYQTRGAGPHLWFNQWTIPLPMNSLNFRLQCWNFSRESIPSIKDPQSNVITHKCRIHNDSSVDISSNGDLVACLVPRDDGPPCFLNFDLKIFSLRSYDFGTCYYKLPQGPNAVSVSLSPSGTFVVVGLASHKVMNYDQGDDNLTIGKIFKVTQRDSFEFVRDIKIKRDDSSLSLNAIKWMPRGIVYNVGPQHHQRYQTARMRNVVAS